MPTLPVKVLLLNPPFKEPIIRDNYCCFTSKSGYLWPPVDLLYLSALLNRPEFTVHAIDAVAENIDEKTVLKQVIQYKPRIVICLTGTVSYQEDLKLLKSIKKHAGTAIYLIGNTPCFQPSYFMDNYPYIDGIFHNFFDTDIAEFLLLRKHCASITYRNSDKTIWGLANILKPAQSLPNINPPQYNLFPLSCYSTPFTKEKPMVTALTSYGCPFNCQFCIGSALQYHQRNLKNLELEFDAMKQGGIKEIFFEDSTFNANTSFLISICNLLIDKAYGFKWCANIHSFNVTAKLLRLMKKAGCHTLQIGVESGNTVTLQKYAPSKKIANIRNAFMLCKKTGIRTLGYFIIGFPNENKSVTENSINFSKELNPDFVSFSALTPDYGTKLFDESVKNNHIKDMVTPFDSSGEPVMQNTKLTLEEQKKMLRAAYFRFYFRPGKIIHYLTDLRNFPNYLKNGLLLIKHVFFP